VVPISVTQTGHGTRARFGNTTWLARSIAAESFLIPARRRDHRELKAAVGHLRTELREQRREIQRLRVENEVLREAAQPLIHHAPARKRFAFIHRLRGRFGIRWLCRILVTDHSNYHAWVRATARRGEHTLDDQELLTWITKIHTAHPAYGAERVTRELKRQGPEIGRRRVARLMREHGTAGITRRKRRNLTKPDKDAAAAVPDLIRREFTAPMPGLKLFGDISCFPTSEGWLSLATVLDLCSKDLIGYAIAPHMRASLVIDAITAALPLPKTSSVQVTLHGGIRAGHRRSSRISGHRAARSDPDR
jgi:hypothetical protein